MRSNLKKHVTLWIRYKREPEFCAVPEVDGERRADRADGAGICGLDYSTHVVVEL